MYKYTIEPFQEMFAAPDFLLQVLWEGLVSGILYALIALGFVLIFRSSRIFNFAQGIMVVFAALTLVGLHAMGVPAWASALGKAGHVAWALVQGGVAGGAVLAGAWMLGSFPELTKEFRDRLPRP